MKLVLKTMVSNKFEVPFLWMMFAEAAPFVDRIIVTEFDRTHSGLPRQFLFDEFVDDFANSFPQLEYLQGSNLKGVIENAHSPEEHHHNETLMRGWFARATRLKRSDVVISTDADEVLYESTYRWVRDHFIWRTRGVRFRLHQFFYRPTYLWEGKEFVAPVALRFGAFDKTYPNDWRYQGTKLSGFWGVHFSWCIPVSEMVKKVKNYSHASEHRHLDDKDLFIRARKEGFFPFDDRDFRLVEISDNSPLLPASFLRFRHTLDPEVLSD